jgi:hypothetical protein
MQISDLTTAENTALVSLAKHLVRADGVVSPTELVDLVELGNAMGMAAFTAAMKATKDRHKTLGDVLTMADAVRRPAARRLIYDYLMAIAEGDALDGAEESLLVQLQRRWELHEHY